jgi:hypothetical protein
MSSPSPAALALACLQQRFCLSRIGGEVRVVDRQQMEDVKSGATTEEIHFMRQGDGDLMMKRHLENQAIPVTNVAQVIKDFKTSPNTLVLDRIAFHPGSTPSTTINFWTDPDAQPVSGDWSVLRDFLFQVICSGDQAIYQYLIGYLAHMVQKPEEKPGVMIVLLGGQGIGKGTLFRLLRRLWPRASLLVSDVELVIGRFNAQLERTYVVCMDEAIFKGDRKAQDRLKSLITEEHIVVEQKYQPSRTTNSIHRIFAFSNHDHFAHVESDDRRMFFIRVSESRKQDTQYFSKVDAAIKDTNVINAMFFDLIKYSLSTFNVRNRPRSKELERQKIQSLTGFPRFWYEALQEGTFDIARSGLLGAYSSGSYSWSDPRFIATEELIGAYANFDKQANRHQPVQSNTVGNELSKMCPSARSVRKSLGNCSIQRRGYQVPHLDTARKEFARYLGCDITWPDSQPRQAGQPLPKDEWAHPKANTVSQASHLPPGWVARKN